MAEIHLLIIWSKALDKKEKIINDLSNKFKILKIFKIVWTKENFSNNLSRFYGENLPKNSGKEKHCGSDSFICIIVRDKNPEYDFRKTSKGVKIVNINLFDVKQLYRSWTGGGHKIHATDDTNETRLQLALLFGANYDDYKEHFNEDLKEITYKHDLIGANGWESFEELFNILNLTSNYVILRNFLNLDEQLTSKHPDIDLLVENKNLIIQILNAQATTKKPNRVQYNVLVAKKNINFDLRYIGDNYYSSAWEYDILDNRQYYNYFFIPNDEHHLYSLIYHALLHKDNISKDYVESFKELFNKQNIDYKMSDFIEVNLLNILLSYMNKNKYDIVEPNDLTVGFNMKLLSKKIIIKLTTKRKNYLIYLYIRMKIKSLILKIIKKLGKR